MDIVYIILHYMMYYCLQVFVIVLKIKHVGYLLVIFNFIIEQELDNDMRKCKEEFKEFERQDVKYREDFKHMNQKIKKLAEKVEKV